MWIWQKCLDSCTEPLWGRNQVVLLLWNCSDVYKRQVKITPAHDPNDFEVGKRHNLEEINILNDDGTINENGGKFAGMDRYEARKAIVKELEEEGYLVRIEAHEHNVGTHDLSLIHI